MKRWALLIALCLLPSVGRSQSLTTLSPPNTIAGSTDMTLTVLGTNFQTGATINWNGVAKSTTFISSSTLTTIINTAQLAAAGAAQVTVTQSGLTLGPLTFQILSPISTGISYQPTVFTPGTNAYVTVTGQGFNTTATVFFDWFPVITTFISPTTLSAFIPGSEISSASQHHVLVYNAAVPAGRPSLQVQVQQKFGVQTTGTTSNQTITITNISASTVTLSSPFRILTGPNSGDFANITGGTCSNGGTLASGASCTATFSFTPSVLAGELAVASIQSNGIGSPQYVNLAGTGAPVAAPALTISPSGLLFGNQVQSTASNSITATVTNSGTSALDMSALVITGTNGSDFTLTGGSCTSTTVLQPGDTCSMTVTFTPSLTSTESAEISITDNAVGSPHLLPLHGSGVTATAHYVALAWTTSTSSNLLGYNIYRGSTNGGPYTLVTPSPVNGTGYNDTQVTHGVICYYVITSVGTNPPYSPVESPDSTQVNATP
jgi:hypothetical protein